MGSQEGRTYEPEAKMRHVIKKNLATLAFQIKKFCFVRLQTYLKVTTLVKSTRRTKNRYVPFE